MHITLDSPPIGNGYIGIQMASEAHLNKLSMSTHFPDRSGQIKCASDLMVHTIYGGDIWLVLQHELHGEWQACVEVGGEEPYLRLDVCIHPPDSAWTVKSDAMFI